MRKYCFCCALAMAFYGCSTRPNNQMVKPLPSSYQTDNSKDAEAATSFSANDFSWKDGKLSMDVFSEDLYDSAEVSKLKAGDTLIYIGEPIVVKDVNFRDSFVTVNGGIEEGGADFTAKRGGTYRGTQLDGHSTYTSLGKVSLPLAADFKLIDCGDNPTDAYDTIKVAQESYLKKVKDYKKDFSPLNTKVIIKNGAIASIIRRWIP